MAEEKRHLSKTKPSEFHSLELFEEGGLAVRREPETKYPEPGYFPPALPQESREEEIRDYGNKRYYDVSFYTDSTTPEDWQHFFKKLSDFHLYSTIFITMKGREVRYTIESGKYLENGNAMFHPFRVSLSNKPEDPQRGLFGLKIVNNKEVVIMDSQEHVNRNRALTQAVIKAGVKPPFDRNFGFGRVYYSNNQSDLLLINDIHKFLSFSMLKTMDKQVEKVKAELKNSDLKLNRTRKKGVFFKRENVEFAIEDFDYFRHGLVVGQTGSGKSKLLELYVKALIDCGLTNEYSVVFMDPHGTVYKDLNNPQCKSIDFKTEAVEPFANVGEPLASTEFTMLLFSSFMDVEHNPQLSRLLRHSLFLLFSIGKMSLPNLNLLLTDTMARKEFLRQCSNPTLQKFFDTEFLEFQTQKYDSTILPIVNLVNEYSLLSSGIDQARQHKLADMLQKHPVLFISTNPAQLGKGATKLIGGALVQQLFTLLQSGAVKKKVILIIDEFSLVQNPAFAQILAESRKFGLTMVVAQQYLGQVDLELLQSIQSNVANLFCFRLSRKDAELAKKMMTMEISAVFESGKSFVEIEEKKLEILTESNPRDCVFRVVQHGKFTRPLKARTIDVGRG